MSIRTTINIKSVGVFILLAVMFTGCAAKLQPVPAKLSQSIRITRVDIKYDKEAFLNWWQVEKEYADKKGIKLDQDVSKHADQHQDLMRTPEARAFVQARLTSVIKDHFSKTILQKFKGHRPVILEVNVKSFDLPSPGRRVLLGGAPMIGAVTILKDAKSGTELAKYDRFVAAHAGGGVIGVLVDQAFDDLHVRVINKYTGVIYNWLSGEE